MADRRGGPTSTAVATAPRVHGTAVVEPGASIGAGTSVWHHAHVRDGAQIGESCTLGKGVFVDAGARIGDRVKVQNGVSVYTGVTIEDDVFVGPSAVFTNDLHPRAFSTDWTVTPTVVRRGASIGANATIVCGVEIGALAMVAAGSVVTRDVEPHRLVMGNPARPRGWVSTCGVPVPHVPHDAVPHDARPADTAPCPACDRPWRHALPEVTR